MFLPASPPSSIEDDWTDEQIMLFLGAWKLGDPLPSNVIMDVNPLGIDPCNAPENIWYLCNLEDPSASRGGPSVENTSCGYWKDLQCDLDILVDSHTFGRKSTWKFDGPVTDNICWMMFEYNSKTACRSREVNFKSLYKVFGVPALDNCDPLQSALLSMADHPEGSEGSEVEDEQGSMSDKSHEDPRNSHLENTADFDFSTGDYLELNDLDDDTDSSSSSSSDNSSRASFSSGEYFDPEALQRDLENASDQAGEGRGTESTESPDSQSSSSHDAGPSQVDGPAHATGPHGSPGNRVGRIAMIGRKYFCFAS